MSSTSKEPKTWLTASDAEVIDALVTAESLVELLQGILDKRAGGKDIVTPEGATYKLRTWNKEWISREKLAAWAEANDIKLPTQLDVSEERLKAEFGPEFLASIKEAGLVGQKEIKFYVKKPSASRRNPRKSKSKVLSASDAFEPENGGEEGEGVVRADGDGGSGVERHESQ